MKNLIGSRHEKEFRQAALRGEVENTPQGIVVRGGPVIRGSYRVFGNGQLLAEGHNLWSDQGLTDALNILFGATAKRGTYYLALYGNAVDPAAGWTAANFVATAGENVSTTEGYTGANRPAWVPGTAAANSMSNIGSLAAYPIRATTSVTFQGAALLSAQARGAGTGVLVSALRFPSPLTLPNNLNFTCQYDLTLSDPA